MLLQSRQFDQLDDDFRPRLHLFAGERGFCHGPREVARQAIHAQSAACRFA
jgi:hypothetical protein